MEYIPGNLNDPCFDWKRPCFGGFNHQNRGQTGSRYTVYTIVPWMLWVFVHLAAQLATIVGFGREVRRKSREAHAVPDEQRVFLCLSGGAICCPRLS